MPAHQLVWDIRELSVVCCGIRACLTIVAASGVAAKKAANCLNAHRKVTLLSSSDLNYSPFALKKPERDPVLLQFMYLCALGYERSL